MSYQFIFGDFSSGKTEYAYNSIVEESLKHPEKMFYMMVPEQNTLKAQQEIIKRHPRHGMLNTDVLSFNLLAYRVMDELGIKKPDILDEVSESMILREACEEVASELRLYGRKLGKPGFINQMKAIISEFYQYGVTEDSLLKAGAASDDNILKAKINDICLIFGEFKRKIKGEYSAAEEIPYILLENIGRSALPDNAVFIFDGFAEFTPVQLKIIAHIMEKAALTRFTLTISEKENPYRRERGPLKAAELYYLTKEMTAKLTDTASGLGINKEPDIWTEHKLEHGIRIVSCRDSEDEAEFAASYIERLVRNDRLRYRDIVIAASDPEESAEAFKRAFSRADIPYFTDTKEKASDNVGAEFIRAAVTACTEGFSEESVLRYIKNPFAGDLLLYGEGRDNEACDEPVNEKRARCLYLKDLCDNYIRALGIKGRKKLEREWRVFGKSFDGINLKDLTEFKDELLAPLFKLACGLSENKVKDKCDALLAFLEEARLPEKVEALCDELLCDEQTADAKKHGRIFEASVELIERLGALMGERSMSTKEFGDILDAGFSELKVGMIPATLDQIIVGDLKRSRFEGAKVLIMTGVNDGLIPSAVSGGGIFSDRERLMLTAGEIELAPADADESCIQNFYLRMNMEKPERELVMSFSRADASGKALKPSRVINDVRDEYFEKHGIRPDIVSSEEFGFIKTDEEALLALAEGLRDEADGAVSLGNRNLELYSALISDESMVRKAENAVRSAAFHYGGGGISERAAELLYGDRLYGSVTRIESFNECAYKHFLRYGLMLSERQQAEVAASDIGNLYHSAIDLTFKLLKERGLSLETVNEEELSRIGADCVIKICEDYNNEIMQSTQRNIYMTEKVKRITIRTLKALKRQLMKGDFKVYGCELPFNYSSERLSLHGRIDRVDRFEDESRVYVKIIDYKSGKTRFDLSMVYEGLQLQLVSYMNVAVKKIESGHGKTAVPAGIFYYNIDDPVTEYDDIADSYRDKEKREEKLYSKLKMNGLTNSDRDAIFHLDRDTAQKGGESDVIPVTLKDGSPAKRGSSVADNEAFRALLDFSEEKLESSSQEIMKGNTEIRPYRKGLMSGCDYCPYHSVCGFDTRVEGFSFRDIEGLKDDEIFGIIGEKYQRNEYKTDKLNKTDE